MAVRVALISGGEGDLARAIRAHLEADGWQVHAPGKVELDVASTASVTAWFAGLSRLDLLINNAGLIDDALVATMSFDQWQRVQSINLDGAFRCSRAALRLMVPHEAGHIINIGSFSALSGPVGQANYAAAKAGLVGLTKSLALEYGASNIRCNCVLPGLLETRMTRMLLEKRREEVLATHALGRLNTTDEAARFIARLDSFVHVSGQVFQLDSRVHGQ